MRFLKAIDHALQFRPKDRPQTVAEWRREFAVMPDARPKVKPPDSAVMGATIAADEPHSAPNPPAAPSPARRAVPDGRAAGADRDEGRRADGLTTAERMAPKILARGAGREPNPPAVPSLVRRTGPHVQAADRGLAAKVVAEEPRSEPVPPSSARSVIRRKGLALALVAVAAVATAAFWAYLNPTAPPGEAVAPESSGQGQTDGIAALLAQAQADFAALRLTAPAGGNALQKYREVLELAPDHAAAKQGLQDIADRFVGLAQQAMAAADFSQASEYLRQAAAIFPNLSDIAKAKYELAREQAAQERETAQAKAKQDQAQAALRAVDAALAEDDAPSVLARLEKARKAGVDPAVLGERRRRLRDRIETLATAAASEAKQALQKNDAAAARAAIERARDLKAQAEALKPAAVERVAAEATAKQEEAQTALRAADAALAKDDARSVLARLEEARRAGVDPAVLAERRRRLRDRIETLATAAASEAKQALQKNDTADARAAIKRARDLRAQAEALDSTQP